ncbi:hypothetical protein [Vibrio astriarenae]|uniref:hypothetical protein n=1 Tax=Vibrio astriarenae TaxID=1481923 RepID=UPI003735B94A
MKHLISLMLLFSPLAHSAYIPSMYSPSGTDRFRSADGSTCEQAVATGKNFQVGIYGSDEEYGDRNWSNYQGSDIGVYASVQFQFGAHQRMDCKRMFDLQLKQMEREDRLAQAEFDLRLMQIQREHERLNSRGNTNFREYVYEDDK